METAWKHKGEPVLWTYMVFTKSWIREDFGGGELKNRLVTHSGIQNLPIPYSEKEWAQREEKNTDDYTEASHYKGWNNLLSRVSKKYTDIAVKMNLFGTDRQPELFKE